jgi:hypothetical protein
MPQQSATASMVGNPSPSLSVFVRRGFHTFTGPCGGKAALMQILSVPVALALATTGLGIAAVCAR